MLVVFMCLQPPRSTRSSSVVTLFRPLTVSSLKITYCYLDWALKIHVTAYMEVHVNVMHEAPALPSRSARPWSSLESTSRFISSRVIFSPP